MHEITTSDGARLHAEDWGEGPPVVFTHGWTVGWEMWEYQMSALAERGLRCIGVDRRGCGRSTSGRAGFGPDRLADDLAQVLRALDLHDVTLVAHSMAGVEAVRLLTRHGTDRVARLALVAATTPKLVAGPDDPNGVPPAVFDEMLAALAADKPAYLAAAAPAFFGGRDAVSGELVEWGVGLARRASLRTSVELLRTLRAADVRDELAELLLPTIVIHGDADASAPVEICARPTAAGIPNARLVVYPGGPHGLPLAAAHKDRLSGDLLAFAADSREPREATRVNQASA